MAKRKSKSSAAHARERQRELDRDESLRFEQNVNMNADAKRAAREREDKLAQAQNDQNQAAAERIKEGDYVKVDLESVPQNIKELSLNRYRQLQQVGAHGVSGRVVGETTTGEGRLLKVDGPTHTVEVPEAAVQRVDLARARSKSTKRKRAAKKPARAKKAAAQR